MLQTPVSEGILWRDSLTASFTAVTQIFRLFFIYTGSRGAGWWRCQADGGSFCFITELFHTVGKREPVLLWAISLTLSCAEQTNLSSVEPLCWDSAPAEERTFISSTWKKFFSICILCKNVKSDVLVSALPVIINIHPLVLVKNEIQYVSSFHGCNFKVLQLFCWLPRLRFSRRNTWLMKAQRKLLKLWNYIFLQLLWTHTGTCANTHYKRVMAMSKLIRNSWNNCQNINVTLQGQLYAIELLVE